jgi:hypothetical protein
MRHGRVVACLTGGALLLGAAYAATRMAPQQSLPFPSRDASPTARPAGAPAVQAAPAGLNLSIYDRHLRSLGLTEREVKQLVLARLEAYLGPSLRPSRYRYWKQNGGYDAAEAERRFAAEDAVRAGLLKMYGDTAAHDSVLQRIFRPLDDKLEFLTSAQQLAVQKARVEHARVAVQETGPGIPPVPVEYRREWRDVVASMLDEQLLLEYSLRESALAEQLRNAPVELSEAEFREVFMILAELEETRSADALRKARGDLRVLLGTQRFDRLWATRDPVYEVVRDLLVRRGTTEATIQAVYGVINSAQDAFAEAASMTDRDPMRAIEAAREIAATEERQIADLVGPELARQIVTARAQALFGLSQRAALPQ